VVFHTAPRSKSIKARQAEYSLGKLFRDYRSPKVVRDAETEPVSDPTFLAALPSQHRRSVIALLPTPMQGLNDKARR
jgi:hypothetical protein